MEGLTWVDRIMMPLSPLGDFHHLESGEYNRIYEAVMRGTEQEGKALVAAIRQALDRMEKKEP